MSVSVEQYNSLVDRIARLEALVQTNWDADFMPARGPIATPQPPQTIAAEDEDEAPLTGALNLLIVPAATHEKALTNCVYFNTGNEADSDTQYLAYSRNMYIMKAVYDPTLPVGRIAVGLFNRLNASLPMNMIRNFFKMGVEGASPSTSLTVKLEKVNRSVDGDDGALPSVEDVHRCLDGLSIGGLRTQHNEIFVVTKANGAVYKATVRDATAGIVRAVTEIIVRE